MHGGGRSLHCMDLSAAADMSLCLGPTQLVLQNYIDFGQDTHTHTHRVPWAHAHCTFGGESGLECRGGPHFVRPLKREGGGGEGCPNPLE